jgi:hypothetical protein
VQWRYGTHKLSRDANGDLNERFRGTVPDSVIVYNTPTISKERLNADLGLYAQDSWTLKRLTLGPGVRFEYFNAKIEAITEPTGRFIGARAFPEVPDRPNWTNVAPRLGAVYDLTGDSKTALKASVNKYNTAADYAAFQSPSPLNGESISIYNLNPLKQGLVDLVDRTAADRSKNRQSYTGFEASISAGFRAS